MKDSEKLALIQKLAERGKEICPEDETAATLFETIMLVIEAEEVIV